MSGNYQLPSNFIRLGRMLVNLNQVKYFDLDGLIYFKSSAITGVNNEAKRDVIKLFKQWEEKENKSKEPKNK